MIEGVSIRERVREDDSEQSLRAAVYARTSSTSREYGYSLDEQVDRGVGRCQQLGWTVRFVYRDEAESGKDTDRPMFQQMLGAAKERMFDVIVFWKLDRFSRSLMHAVQLESELREYDVFLYSVTEQIDTTSPTGRFNFRNLASAAEFERDMIKQRTQIGLNGLAEDHKWPNDNPPLGYNLTPENRLVIDDEESDLVVDIFEMYLEERSMPEVADQLNLCGFKTRDGNDWSRSLVGNILRNEIYRGKYEVGDIVDHVPEYRIISDKIFEQVTEVRMRFQEDNATRPTMSADRKERMVRDLRNQYDAYLDSCR
jgi:site-specific DNA recombinase